MEVVRYPIETWSRPQLEDNYHNLVEELQNCQKKIKENEKEIKAFHSRFRKNLLQRKKNNDTTVEREKFDECVKEKQILEMKLKAAKHQLLLYTNPMARAATASAITGRSTFRQQPPQSTWRTRADGAKVLATPGSRGGGGVSIDRAPMASSLKRHCSC
ncbi:unnamed protein product [Caenorhabditis angaria]|uniref:Uncharacterized protein n=1 Tax=Caenorhabditis angaria TaxID=860376 RepID=A0A9P1IET0_9PELO|nr:unnamed protein product [Caenorhabditis angaria]